MDRCVYCSDRNGGCRHCVDAPLPRVGELRILLPFIVPDAPRDQAMLVDTTLLHRYTALMLDGKQEEAEELARAAVRSGRVVMISGMGNAIGDKL